MMSSEELGFQRTMHADFFELLDSRESGLASYSPFSFLRDCKPEMLFRDTFAGPLKKDISAGKANLAREEVDGCRTWFVWRIPGWDSAYFNRKVVKVDLILPEHDSAEITGRAINRFTEGIVGDNGYISINIPCEDLMLLRAMALTGYRLVETRLNYYFNSFDKVLAPVAPARTAGIEDIPALREVAMQMRNRFDRVHADPAFSDQVADDYLGTFIEQSVRGFADMVMVPDMAGVRPFAFLASDYPADIIGFRIAKLVLAAADNREHKGWLSKLLAAVLFELKKHNTDILTTITQASNRPAIRTWENAGFRLGFVTHLYSYSER